MLLRPFYNVFLKELKPLYGYDEAVAISNMIFEEKAGIKRTGIIAEPDSPLAPETIAILEDALLMLKKYIPVQYVIGKAWFYQLSFKVNEAVLIPRPETEELVHEAIQYIIKNKKQSCLDIGTGSGCIPVSIKKNIESIQISAIDTSIDALNIAKENAAIHNTAINFIKADFLKEDQWNQFELYDVIVSNPPYIPIAEKQLLSSNVADHEPALALFVPDDDPLIFYKKIAAFGKIHLQKEGCIFMETHMAYTKEVADYFNQNGYNANVKKDMFEKDRMVIATLYH